MAIAAGHGDAPAAEGVEIAGPDLMVGAAADVDGVAGHFSDGAAFEDGMAAVADVDAVGGAAFPEEALESDMGDTGQFEQGGGGEGQFDEGLGRGEGGVPVEFAALAVEVPLVRLVQFGQEVDGVEALVLPVAVAVPGFGEGDLAGLGVDRLDLLVGIRPVPEPVAMEPGVRFIAPAEGAVALEAEASLGRAGAAVPGGEGERAGDLAGFDEVQVGPAGDGHGEVVDEQFGGGVGLEAAPAGEAAADPRGRIRDAFGGEIAFDDVGAGGFGESLEDGGVGDLFEGGQSAASVETWGGGVGGAVDDGCRGGAGVLGLEAEGLGDGVEAGVDPDLGAGGGEAVVLAEGTDGITRLVEGWEGVVAGAIGTAAAGGGDVEAGGLVRLGWGCGVGARGEGEGGGEGDGEAHGSGWLGGWGEGNGGLKGGGAGRHALTRGWVAR